MPNTFPLWLKSAIANPTIDFIIVTDQKLSMNETNIKVVNMSFDECVQLIENKLNMKVAINRPYKLCDFKPAYGVIFSDYLKGYDYWGHCDVDMIFGDIRHFCEEYDLNQYDKFLTEGHLALYRNTEKCKWYFSLKGSYVDYIQAFTNEQIFVFDENIRINGIYKYNGFPLFEKRIYANITPLLKRFTLCNLSLRNYKKQVFCYDDGKIIRYAKKGSRIVEDEFMYIHLLKRQMPDCKKEILDSDFYCITDRGYFLSERNAEDIIDKFSFYPGFWPEFKIKLLKRYIPKLKLSSIKMRCVFFLFRFQWGRKILGKDF